MSVSEYLKGKEFERGLGREFTLTYLQQLTKAAGYLHTRNILYLNWTCKLQKHQHLYRFVAPDVRFLDATTHLSVINK